MISHGRDRPVQTGEFQMRFAVRLLAAAAVVFAAVPAAAEAEQQTRRPCHDYGEIHKQLSKKYDEAPVAFGLQTNGNLLQIYASEDKGTWTVISTSPAGLACIVAAGKSWEALPFKKDSPIA